MTPNNEVRVADDSDLAAIAHLRARWVKEKRRTKAQPEFLDRFMAWHERQADHRRAWLALVEGEPVGMANLMVYERMPTPDRPPASWGYVGAMFVVPEQRGTGLGRSLLETLITWATAEGLERLVLNPSQRSVPFYERLGFGPPPALLQLDLPGAATY